MKVYYDGRMKYQMSQKESLKLEVIQYACQGLLTVEQAARRLGLSARRIKQLKKGFRERGVEAVIHGNANRKSLKLFWMT